MPTDPTLEGFCLSLGRLIPNAAIHAGPELPPECTPLAAVAAGDPSAAGSHCGMTRALLWFPDPRGRRIWCGVARENPGLSAH